MSQVGGTALAILVEEQPGNEPCQWRRNEHDGTSTEKMKIRIRVSEKKKNDGTLVRRPCFHM